MTRNIIHYDQSSKNKHIPYRSSRFYAHFWAELKQITPNLHITEVSDVTLVRDMEAWTVNVFGRRKCLPLGVPFKARWNFLNL